LVFYPVPCWTLGKRDGETADAFVSDMASRLTDRAQITSDGLAAYMDAIVKAWLSWIQNEPLPEFLRNRRMENGQVEHGIAVVLLRQNNALSVHGQSVHAHQ
jgi:hypothetical protein